eukprot:GFKZ01015895.1.p1 GENE.GFKZ01015895.1~~GFKZ01015895.1.p1  ORF type:complete len:369 (-),score=51.42 GFKZ01015895.1:1220-2326(-)
MGRGKSWSREESEAVAKAWKKASENKMSVREQNSKGFVAELYQRFVELAPQDSENLDGRWTARSQTAVKTQFDAIGDDVFKFNAVLSNVVDQAAKQDIAIPKDKLLRAAIGVHLGAIAGAVNFEDIDSVESDWKLYGAWRILKTCQRFTPQNWPNDRRRGRKAGCNNQGEHSEDGPDTHVQRSPSMENGHGNHAIGSPKRVQAGGTPMRTLATAALSMNLGPGGIRQLTHAGRLKREDVGVDEADENGRDCGPHGRVGKRKAENSNTEEGRAGKQARSSVVVDMLSSGSSALEKIADALCGLGDALSEYNAISLFSRSEMQGRDDRQEFFDALAEKHVLKAKLDRDKLIEEVVLYKGKQSEGSHSVSR